MSVVVFDIETVGSRFEELDEAQRAYLLSNAKSEQEQAKIPEWTSLWALTGKIVALGMGNPETGKGRVWYETTGGRSEETSDDDGWSYVGADEATFLAEFWSAIAKYDRFVTFNGRGFDGPFLMLRSAILGVKPSRNLVPYRYSVQEHVDLLEVVTFFGAVRKFNLDFCCKAFGIPSPKEGGIDGYSVGPFYRDGRVREIARYCRRDVEATGQLYLKLRETLLPLFERGRV
jgi:DNA polymerase elongation subunit (family B)